MSHVPVNQNSAEQAVLDGSSATRLLDVGGLAERLGVRTRYIRRLVHERRIPFLKIGKFVRFDPREIDEWVDARRQCPDPMQE